MKLSPRDATSYFARPDPAKAGVLIFGADGQRVAHHRKTLLDALLGPTADEDMRLTRISGAELRKTPALVLDAIKAVGFFPGLRGVLIDEANDGAFSALETALQEWTCLLYTSPSPRD